MDWRIPLADLDKKLASAVKNKATPLILVCQSGARSARAVATAKKLGYDNPYGTYVSGIIPNSGADRAGLKTFDYIFGFDEYRVGDEQHLGIIMKKYKPGEKATVHFIRKGKKSSAPLTFTKPFQAEKKEMNSCDDPFFGIIQINSEDGEGVVISPVKGSTAADLALKEGDVLTHINGFNGAVNVR